MYVCICLTLEIRQFFKQYILTSSSTFAISVVSESSFQSPHSPFLILSAVLYSSCILVSHHSSSVLAFLCFGIHSLPTSIFAILHINLSFCQDGNSQDRRVKPDVPRRLALSNFEHLVSLSSEHRAHRQTDS